MEDGKLNSNPIAPAGNFRGHAKLSMFGLRSLIPCLQKSAQARRVVSTSAVLAAYCDDQSIF